MAFLAPIFDMSVPPIRAPGVQHSSMVVLTFAMASAVQLKCAASGETNTAAELVTPVMSKITRQRIRIPRRLRSIFSIVFSIEILLSIIDMVLRSGSRADSRPERSAPPRRTAAELRSCVPAGYTSVLFGCAHYICLTGNRQCLPCTVSGQNFVIETNPHFAPETVFDAKNRTGKLCRSGFQAAAAVRRRRC